MSEQRKPFIPQSLVEDACPACAEKAAVMTIATRKEEG